jgi:Cupredoxin-like domain
MSRAITTIALLIAVLALPNLAVEARAQEFIVTIKNHRFEPTELRIPAGKRVTIYVVNEDPTPEEFESLTMKFEKIIPGKSKGLVRVGPLAPGRYDFFGEFNMETAKGVVIAE